MANHQQEVETVEHRAFRGVWIPAALWLERSITLQEKVMLVEIDSLQHPERGCWKSNAALAEFFGISRARVTQIIASLKEKGLIRVENVREGRQIVERRIYIVAPLERGQESYQGWKESYEKGGKNPRGGRKESYEERGSVRGVHKEGKEEGESLPSWLPEDAWHEYLQFRKEMKAPMSALAQTKAINKLDKLRKEGSAPAEVIDQSIVNGWKGLFPIKGEGKRTNGQTPPNPYADMDDCAGKIYIPGRPSDSDEWRRRK